MTLKERKARDPFWKTRAVNRVIPGRGKPLRRGEKRKFTVGGFTGIVHEDTDADSSKLTYSREGPKCTRCFVIEHIDIAPTAGSAGYGTIWDAMFQSGIPVRGDDHPYINASTWNSYFGVDLPPGLDYAADVITVTPVDSMNMRVTVEYAILNGATREPSSVNDAKPGLLHISSSVRNAQTTVDKDGNPLIAPYNPGSPAYDIFDRHGKAVTTPTSVVIASKEVPVTILRFTRRQTVPSTTSYVGKVNSAAWTINYHEYGIHELLCTRCESETEDGGFSYIVTYEFQAKDSVAAYNTDNTIRGWEMGGFYQIQNGYAIAHADATLTQRLSEGNIPSDAPSAIFQIYDELNFLVLGLTPP